MKRLLLMLVSGAALWSAACGGGNGIAVPPPPVGKYTLASLNGQYVFATSGESFVAGAFTATPLARTGVFNADGHGKISGGVEDVNANGITSLALQISGGTYTVNADGRGTLTLDVTSNGVTSSIDFGIVLTSTSDGFLIDETSNNNQASTGSGNFVLQTGGPFTVGSVAGPYIFDFSGLDGNQTSPCPCPESFVGRFDVNNAGTITSGFFDDNDNGTFGSGAVVGNFAPDPLNPSFPISTFGRGIAQIARQNFVFYIVDATRVRMISTNGGMLSGDTVAQSNTVPANVSSISSNFVFIVAGSSGNGGITRVGRFTANGATVTNVLVDTNNAGQFIKTNTTNNASISLDVANPGRGTVTFTDPNFASAPFNFVFYLSSATQGVIQETTTNNSNPVDVADGTIAAQTGSPFSSGNITGTYALNWSGLSLQNNGSFSAQDEEDLLSQVTVSSLGLSGAADIFQFQNGVPVFDLVTSGTIAISGDGTSSPSPNRNTMSVKLVKSNSTTVNLVVYFVSPQLAFFANNQDSHRTVAGILQAQQ
ncbi:MAG TPA: hypothetical protein VFN26_02085 [Candidatus Acidoferrum sp.]|nr:hypothetical protein [Candidatus Acidoferrum sp.]